MENLPPPPRKTKWVVLDAAQAAAHPQAATFPALSLPNPAVLVGDNDKELGVLDQSFKLPFLSSEQQVVYGILPFPTTLTELSPRLNLEQTQDTTIILTTNGLLMTLKTYRLPIRLTADQKAVEDCPNRIQSAAYDFVIGHKYVAQPNSVVTCQFFAEMPGSEYEANFFFEAGYETRIETAKKSNKTNPLHWYQFSPTAPSTPTPKGGAQPKNLFSTSLPGNFQDEHCMMLCFSGHCPDMNKTCFMSHDVCYDQVFAACNTACGRIHLEHSVKKEWVRANPQIAAEGKAEVARRTAEIGAITTATTSYDKSKIYPRSEVEDTFLVITLDSTRHQTIISSTQCAICFSSFEAGDQLTKLPCPHNYHPDCLADWLDREYKRIEDAAPKKEDAEADHNAACPECHIAIMRSYLQQKDASASLSSHDDGEDGCNQM